MTRPLTDFNFVAPITLPLLFPLMQPLQDRDALSRISLSAKVG